MRDVLTYSDEAPDGRALEVSSAPHYSAGSEAASGALPTLAPLVASFPLFDDAAPTRYHWFLEACAGPCGESFMPEQLTAVHGHRKWCDACLDEWRLAEMDL